MHIKIKYSTNISRMKHFISLKSWAWKFWIIGRVSCQWGILNFSDCIYSKVCSLVVYFYSLHFQRINCLKIWLIVIFFLTILLSNFLCYWPSIRPNFISMNGHIGFPAIKLDNALAGVFTPWAHHNKRKKKKKENTDEQWQQNIPNLLHLHCLFPHSCKTCAFHLIQFLNFHTLVLDQIISARSFFSFRWFVGLNL